MTALSCGGRGALLCGLGLLLLLFATARAEESQRRFSDGAALFEQNCAVCHRPDGTGQAGLAPPLTRYPGRYVAAPAGRRLLALTVLYGLFGDVVVEGGHYNFKMPEFGQLADDSLAAVLNFVAFDLAHAPADAAPLSAKDIAAARQEPKSGTEVRSERGLVLTSLGL